MAAQAKAEEKPAGPSLVVQIGLLAALTAGAVGGGWLTGSYLVGGEARGSGTLANVNERYQDEDGSDRAAETLRIFRLEPITTNLGGPGDVWVRAELALVFEERPDPELAEVLHQDILAYLRTVKVHQVEGASGFQHLRADLDERVRLRSEGKVRQVLIRTLLYE